MDDTDYNPSPCPQRRTTFKEECFAKGVDPAKVVADEVATRLDMAMADHKAELYNKWVKEREVEVPAYHIQRFRCEARRAVPHATTAIEDPTLGCRKPLCVAEVCDKRAYLDEHVRWLAHKGRLTADVCCLANLLDGKSFANHRKHFSCGLCLMNAERAQTRDCAVPFWGCLACESKGRVAAGRDHVGWGDFVRSLQGATVTLRDGRVLRYLVVDTGDLPALYTMKGTKYFSSLRRVVRTATKHLKVGQEHPKYSTYLACPSCPCSLKQIHSCDPAAAAVHTTPSKCLPGDFTVYEVLHGLATLLTCFFMDLFVRLEMMMTPESLAAAERLVQLMPPSFQPCEDSWVEVAARVKSALPQFSAAASAAAADGAEEDDDEDDDAASVASDASSVSAVAAATPAQVKKDAKGKEGAKVNCWRFDPSDMQYFFGKNPITLARRSDGTRVTRGGTKQPPGPPPILRVADELGECLPQVRCPINAPGRPPVWPVRTFCLFAHKLAMTALTPIGHYPMSSGHMKIICQFMKEVWLVGVAPQPLYLATAFHLGTHLVLDHWWHVHRLLYDYGGIKICRRDGWENQQGAERRLYTGGAHKGGRGRLKAHKAHWLLGDTILEKFCLWRGSVIGVKALVGAYCS